MDKSLAAFPEGDKIVEMSDGSKGRFVVGLTKREWYAGMALQGLLARNNVTYTTDDGVAMTAFRFADAMLAESQKDKPC